MKEDKNKMEKSELEQFEVEADNLENVTGGKGDSTFLFSKDGILIQKKDNDGFQVSRANPKMNKSK